MEGNNISKLLVTILDDNEEFLSEFSDTLKKDCALSHHPFDLLTFTTCEDYENVIAKKLRAYDFCISFVDVLLEGENGIRMAKRLQEKHPALCVIFISAVLENALDIFHASPTYFLAKPIGIERLNHAIELALGDMNVRSAQVISLKLKNGLHKINIQDILYIESMGRKVIFQEADKSTISNERISDYVEKLEGSFILSHRSYLVNLRHIRYIEGLEIVLLSGARVPIARNRLPDVKAAFFGKIAHREGDKNE